jgi:hypothetical protein
LVVGDLLDSDAPGILDVANGGKLHIRLLQETPEVVCAAATDSNSTQHDTFTGRHRVVLPQGSAGHHVGNSEQRSCPGNGLDELPPVESPIFLRHDATPLG